MSDQANSRSLRTLVCVAAVIVVAMMLSRGLTVWGLREDTIADVERDTGNLATVFADQISQSVKDFDIALIEIAERLATMHRAAPEKYPDAIRSEDVSRLLANVASRLPQAHVIGVLSPDGYIANHSAGRPVPHVDVSDREFFIAQKAANSGLYVSLAVLSRVDRERTLFFSRRIESRRGEFLGVVQIGLKVSHFRHIYNSIRSLSDQSFLFLRSDGTVLANYPDQKDRAGEKMPPQSPWYDALARGSGFYRSSGDLDDDARFVAVRKVAGYPLVVDVAASESASLARWRRRANLIAFGTVLTLVCFVVLVRTLMVQFRKLTESRASLAEREGKLSEKSRELERANRTIDTALNTMSQGLTMIDGEGRIVICNERYIRMYGIPPALAEPGTRLADILAYRRSVGNFDEDPEAFVATLQKQMAAGERVQTRQRLPDGRLISVVMEPMKGGGWVATQEDVTERQRDQERIARMARHDALTDLANRMLFRERMD